MPHLPDIEFEELRSVGDERCRSITWVVTGLVRVARSDRMEFGVVRRGVVLVGIYMGVCVGMPATNCGCRSTFKMNGMLVFTPRMRVSASARATYHSEQWAVSNTQQAAST